MLSAAVLSSVICLICEASCRKTNGSKFLKFRLCIISLGAATGLVFIDKYVKLCQVIPLCSGLNMIPLECVSTLFDTNSKSIQDCCWTYVCCACNELIHVQVLKDLA